MSFEYVAPVYVGDTITCTVTVLEKDEPRHRVVCGVDYVNGEAPRYSGPVSPVSPARLAGPVAEARP